MVYNDKDDSGWNVDLEKMLWPGQISSCLSLSLDLPLPYATVLRVSDEVFNKGRGNIDIDPSGDYWVAHLTLNLADRVAVPGFLDNVTDVWLGINAVKVGEIDPPTCTIHLAEPLPCSECASAFKG